MEASGELWKASLDWKARTRNWKDGCPKGMPGKGEAGQSEEAGVGEGGPCAGGPARENSTERPREIKTRAPDDPATPLLGVYPK